MDVIYSSDKPNNLCLIFHNLILWCIGLQPFLQGILVHRPCENISIGAQPNLLDYAANPLPILSVSYTISPVIIHTIAKAILVQLI